MEPHLQIEIAVPLIRFAGLTEVVTHKSQAVSCINKPSKRVLARRVCYSLQILADLPILSIYLICIFLFRKRPQPPALSAPPTSSA